MYEIKKIVPFSIAKYLSLTFLTLRFLFYVFSILYDFISSPEYFKTTFTPDVGRRWFINVAIDLILVYIFSFIMIYFFAFIYNIIIRKTKIKGIMVEFDLVEKENNVENKISKSIEYVDIKEKKGDRFVV